MRATQRERRSLHLAILIVCGAIAGGSGARGETVVFPREAAGAEDTTLQESSPHAGRPGALVWVGGGVTDAARALLRFDVSALAHRPAPPYITGARLKLTVQSVAGTAAGQSYALYRVAPTNKDWGAQGPTVPGGATWAYRAERRDATGSAGVWAGSDGCSVPGIDYIATPVATAEIPAAVAPGTVVTWSFTDTSFFSDWSTDKAGNAGFILMTDMKQHAFVRFCASDSPQPADRPALEVDVSDTAPAPTAPTQPLTKGLRVFTCAHSFHWFVGGLLTEMAHAAGFKDHTQVGLSSIGGSWVSQHWEVPWPENLARQTLTAGKADVMTVSPIWLPDEGIADFAKLGVANNPNFRLTVQEFWMPNDEYHPVRPLDTGKHVDHNATNLAELRKAQDAYDADLEALARDLDRQLGRDAVLVVPVGEAVVALRDKIAAGQAFGVKTQAELFSDSWGHPTAPIQALDAYCHFAVIYRRSPVGLPLPSVLGASNNQDWEDAQFNQLLQTLAWEAVNHHPFTGVAAP